MFMFTYTAKAVEFSDKISDLCWSLSQWSQATFGSDSERGPRGPLRHLAKEVEEAEECLDADPFDREAFAVEMADCLLLVIDAARRGGVTFLELIDAAVKKQKVNESRKWPKPVDDQPVEHVR